MQQAYSIQHNNGIMHLLPSTARKTDEVTNGKKAFCVFTNIGGVTIAILDFTP